MKKLIGIAGVMILSMFWLVGCSGGVSSTAKKGIVMTESSIALALNENYNTVQLNVEVPSGTKVDWSSSNTTIATVNDSGEVTAHAVGEATIIATIDGTSTQASCTVKVYQESPINMTPTGIQEIYTGNTLTYQAFDSADPGSEINCSWAAQGGISVTSQGRNTALVTADTPGDAGVFVTKEGESFSVFGKIVVKPSIEVLQHRFTMVYGQSPVDLSSVFKLPPGVSYTDVVYAVNSYLISVTPTATGGEISFNQLQEGDKLPFAVMVSLTINKKEANGQVYQDTQSLEIDMKPPISCSTFSPNHYVTETLTLQGTENLEGGSFEWSDGVSAVTIKNGDTMTPTININSATNVSPDIIDDTIDCTYVSPTKLTYTLSLPLKIYTTLGKKTLFSLVGKTASAIYPLPIPNGWTVSFSNYDSNDIQVNSIDASQNIISNNISTSSDPITGMEVLRKQISEKGLDLIDAVATGPNGEKVTGFFRSEFLIQ